MKEERKTTRKDRYNVVIAAIIFFILVLGIVVGMTVKNTVDLMNVLEESIVSQLNSITEAAGNRINADGFDSYNSEEDARADWDNYLEIRKQLRELARDTGAEYIYAIKYIDGKYMFVFDTDTEDEEIFVEYELSDVHKEAFAGKVAAGVMNVEDEWGSYNTGARPIMKDDKVIGIVCADILDEVYQKSTDTARTNSVILIVILFVTMGAMLTFLFILIKRVKKMQDKLKKMAHYDTVTGLPNRQYLIEYLEKITSGTPQIPFAMLFIDLDNFKRVNDNAGHDAGDELLRHIAKYLESVYEDSKAFRPAPGMLNVAARIGGDEFVQVVPNIATEAEAEELAKKLLDGFKNNIFDRYIDKYNVGLSVGIALYPYHTDNYHVLIKYADIAMYHSKNSGKSCYRIYQDDMKQKDEK